MEAADATTARESTAKPIGVLVKAFAVLEAMAALNRPAPLRDIADRWNLPKGTLFRILQMLSGLGYVARNTGTGCYYLIFKLSSLGHSARLEGIKLPLCSAIEDLHCSFNETVNLGVLDAPFVNYVAVLEARRALSWGVSAGTRDLFHCTAPGRAIVAYLPDDQRHALLGRTSLDRARPEQ